MKDIDFDELDKAVSSLMGSVEQSKDTQATVFKADEPILEQPAEPETQPAPVSTPVATSEPIKTVEASPAVAIPPAARRSGRFMDMVNTPNVNPKPRPVAPSREGLTIAPRKDVPETKPDEQVETPSQVAPVSFDSMPDPIDMNQEKEPAAEAVTTPLVEEQDQASLAPIESPFLTDAKVEKRPLNAGTLEQSSAPSIDLSDLDSQLSAESQTPEQPASDADSDNGEVTDEPPVSPQVPELNSDLVAIESNEKIESTQAVETNDAATQVEAPSQPLGAASIAQQYKSQPSSGDQSHAAIYDASQYPEPISHPAKNKTGWLWVLWVVLLLGVGAGGAVLLYALKIIP